MTAGLTKSILFYCVICIFHCFCGINGQKNINDACEVARTGAAGVCRIINECPVVVTELAEQHLEPAYCGFINRKRIVCCPIPKTEQLTTTPRTLYDSDRISLKSICLLNPFNLQVINNFFLYCSNFRML